MSEINLYNVYRDSNIQELENALLQACEDRQFDRVKFLLTDKRLKKNPSVHAHNDVALHISCEKGYLEITKYLLTSPELNEHANIHSEDGNALAMACYYGHLETVKYLLTSPDLKEHADMYATNCLAFKDACRNSHEHIIDYLLNSPDLPTHIDIHYDNDCFFHQVISCRDFQLAHYFIFDLNIEKTENIERFLKDPSMQEVVEMFKLRELNEDLHKELGHKESIVKKAKI